ncbi:hypothetical protein KIN20_030498, partial [Parelaphostrongylus tenuis]
MCQTLVRDENQDALHWPDFVWFDGYSHDFQRKKDLCELLFSSTMQLTSDPLMTTLSKTLCHCYIWQVFEWTSSTSIIVILFSLLQRIIECIA